MEAIGPLGRVTNSTGNVDREGEIVNRRCPRCDSPAPHLHPATQHEGEAQVCPHVFHRQVTARNTPARLARLVAC